MKLIGVLGGISPVSTAYYYEVLNGLARERLGGRHSARCLIHSVDFAGVEAMHLARDWPGVTRELRAAARSLEDGGAACVILACNTMHNVAEDVADSISIPFLHIGDAVAAAVRSSGATRVGLLGTRFTMNAPFIRGRLVAHDVDVVVPDKAAQDEVHGIIYDELCAGIIRDASRDRLRSVIDDMVGSQELGGMVLGCTEIGLLLDAGDLPVRGFDTSRIHAQAAMDFSLAGAH